MKSWQCGYDLEYLKGIESFYQEYNNYALSPFAQFKKNDIAKALKNKELVLKYPSKDNGLGYNINAVFTIKQVKVRTPIYAYNDVLIGRKEKGDIVISHLAGDLDTLIANLMCYEDHGCWLYVWAENKEHNRIAKECGYRYIHGKITTFGEIYSVYYRDKKRNGWFDESRLMPQIEPAEKINVKKLNLVVDLYLIDEIANRLKNLDRDFTNHYSNYNKKHSWSAVSLRGYTNDPGFITKPLEMNDKWHKEHEDWIFKLQDTPMYDLFPEVRKLLAFLDGPVHRIRFMALAPNDGELRRHTDLVDPEMGVKPGNLVRLHFPIITNPKVIFTSWNYNGKQTKINMKVGECFYLDIRKPHRAINGGKERRIHLVVDAEVTPKLLGIING
jgi:hypothetical protein